MWSNNKDHETLRKVVLLLFISGVLLQGCGNETYKIPSGNRPFFKTGDTLLFKAPSGNADTLVVTINPGFIQHDKGDSYERLVIRYHKIKNKTKEQNDLLHVTQYVNGAAVASRTTSFISERTIDQFQLSNGSTIHKVAEFKRSPRGIAYPDIELIYHYPRYGVVRYTYFDGESFELVLP